MPAPVVVVHDEIGTLDLALNALQAAGHEVVGFADPLAALDAIDAGSLTSVLVTRIEFRPGKLNGVALARMVSFRRPDIKVAFIGLLADRRHVERSGDFLPMPLDPDA